MEATLRTPTVKDGGDDENTDGGTDDGSDTQANILATENLYTLRGNWPGLGPNTLLLDVCYVTRRIGATLPYRVGMVTCSHRFQKSFNSRF
ncbi:Methyltransferase domain-containing protein [Artemisia annua]|uniref:Methyltransferase domain-containing protein n=1 Tax=Artemisia annua TaxID=35608 RepID=A0A2U1LMP6_ARTAN|nr:Methyltransferase domain-containing protein [Artemisia annua]